MSNVQPVKCQVVVEASQERAFQVFTEDIDRWWPREHHIGKSPLKREVLETRAGGRWYGLSEDGTECEVGKVLTWDPPRRVVLAWQITAQWQYDASFLTEVEVTFTAEGPKKTRVVLEHRDLERYGDAASEFRKSVDGGWQKLLEDFARAAAA